MHFHLLATQAAERSTLTMMVGCFLLLFTVWLMVGLLRCVRALRRTDVNRKCYHGFIFFTSGWLLYAAIAALSIRSEHRVILVLAGLALFGVLGLTGVVFAILGLSELKRDNLPGRKGRAQAVTTLVLAGLVAAMIASTFAFGVAKGFMEARQRRAEGSKAVFEDLGFSIHPPGEWVRVDTAQINPLAAVAYRRGGPEAYFMIIAEKQTPGAGLELDAVVEGIMNHLESVSDELKILHQGDEVVNGLAGRRVVCEASIKNIPITYLYWFHVTPDRIFQLIAWGNRRDASTAIAEGRKAFDGFTMLQPK
ncbi:MAG TPA: hypothetical protein VJU16_00360 [Planctomycetota bacterium]|nr:hypothetical protein [Planctomycetota bacterium]